MGDDGLSASQLRKRYGPGGSAGDSALSASQLRARHNVNNRDFQSGGGNLMVIILAIVGLLAAAAVYKFVLASG